MGSEQFRRNCSDPKGRPTGTGTARYRAQEGACQACPSRATCYPTAEARKITRQEHVEAWQFVRDIAGTYLYEKTRFSPILRL